MGVFNDAPTIPICNALRTYWPRLAFLAAQPIVGAAFALVLPEIPAMVLRGAVFVLAGVTAMWPIAFRDVPVSCWMLACVSWFAVNIGMIAVATYL